MSDYTFLDGFTLMIRGLCVMLVCFIRGLTIFTIELLRLIWEYKKELLLGIAAIIGALSVTPLIIAFSWLIV